MNPEWSIFYFKMHATVVTIKFISVILVDIKVKQHFVVNKASETWKTSLLVGVELTKDSVKMNFHPIYQTSVGMDIASGELEKEIMDSFATRNEELKNGTWINGWDAFVKANETMYRYMLSPEYAIDFKNEEQGEQVKAHFLDCEAHLDVIKHIYKSWNETNEI